jgi:RimJ/RimL family protein N-acetyltransferase
MFIVEPLVESDINDMYQAVHDSRDHLEELDWLRHTDAQQFVQHYKAILAMSALSIFAIRVNGQFAGAVELQDHGDHMILGYWLGLQYRGQGIATQAVGQVLGQYHKTIRADTTRSNPDSSAVLERLDFVFDYSDEEKNYYSR